MQALHAVAQNDANQRRTMELNLASQIDTDVLMRGDPDEQLEELRKIMVLSHMDRDLDFESDELVQIIEDVLTQFFAEEED